MNVVKCQNGHFYDGDNYAACPHCGAGVSNGATNDTKDKGGRKSILGGLLNHDKPAKTVGNSMPNPTNYANSVQPGYQPTSYGASSVTEAAKPVTNSVEINGNAREDKGHTIDFWGPASQSQEPIVAEETPAVPVVEPSVPETPVASAVPAAPEMPTALADAPATDSLKDVVQKASANTSGKTMGYFERVNKSAPAPAAGTVTSAAPAQHKSNGPVVGWLVCIAGNHIGQSFELGAGKNSIGRSEDNNVVLCNDGGVSGLKHALIVYEPKKRDFYLQPGDSSGLTYLNEEFITEIKQLSSRDIIELGDTKLMFIPLCCQDFSWEEYLK